MHPDSILLCNICLKKSNYVCPRCGINYCSLPCYRSRKHSQCSESFYHDCVVDSLKNAFVNNKNRNRMLDILRRVGNILPEQKSPSSPSASVSADDPYESSDSVNTETLIHRFSDLDLESNEISSEVIWSRLTMKEKREFCRLVNTGAISNYLPQWTPWWQNPKKLVTETSDAFSHFSLPLPMSLSNIFPSGRSPHYSVGFMLLDFMLGYAFICRFYNGDTHDLSLEASSNLLQIVASCGRFSLPTNVPTPKKHRGSRTSVITPVRSSVAPMYTSISQVVGSIQTKLCEHQFPCNAELMIVLLQDANALLEFEQNVCDALDDIHVLLLEAKKELQLTCEPHNQSSFKRILSFANQKLLFLRSCFNPHDPSAIGWQSAIYPGLKKALQIELCALIANGEVNVRPSRPQPTAGPNWQQMIRDVSSSAQTHNLPYEMSITPTVNPPNENV